MPQLDEDGRPGARIIPPRVAHLDAREGHAFGMQFEDHTHSGFLIICFLRDMSDNTSEDHAMLVAASFAKASSQGACCAGGVDSYLA
jgi:hypothetical protein